MSRPFDSSVPMIGRRRFIQGALAMGAAVVADQLSLSGSAFAAGPHNWSSPETWGGRVPGRRTVARINKPVLLDVNARVAGVVIEPGGSLTFHSDRSTTLRSRGNIIVRGLLSMAPATPAVRHRIVFVDVDERRFEGKTLDPVASDVGLWVMGRGLLKVDGAPKLAWTRAEGSIAQGTAIITLSEDPVGWQVGDEISITPTLPPGVGNHFETFDLAVITAVDGRNVTMSSPTRFDHPSVEVAQGRTFSAEVLNLTRNVMIEGTEGGRAHIFMRSSKPQTIKYLAARYLGPRKRSKKDRRFTEVVVGRWPVHFHHAMDGSRGSTVEGVVARNVGSHAYVAHMSHGVTFRDCIAFKVLESPYWWDEPTRGDPSRTKDLIYDRCVAANVEYAPPHRGGTVLRGFFMAQGSGLIARGCLAVGVKGQNDGDSSGFGWDGARWTFEDCVAHNNKNLGTRFWVNHPTEQVMDNFVAYHNGRFGSMDGAYGNSVDYVDSIYYRNGGVSQFHAKATSHLNPKKTMRSRFDAAGATDYCVDFSQHVGDPEGQFTIYQDCDFKGATKAQCAFIHVATPKTYVPDLVKFINCTFDGNEFWLGNDIHPESSIVVQDPVHGDIELRRFDYPLGIYKPEWNAKIVIDLPASS